MVAKFPNGMCGRNVARVVVVVFAKELARSWRQIQHPVEHWRNPVLAIRTLVQSIVAQRHGVPGVHVQEHVGQAECCVVELLTLQRRMGENHVAPLKRRKTVCSNNAQVLAWCLHGWHGATVASLVVVESDLGSDKYCKMPQMVMCALQQENPNNAIRTPARSIVLLQHGVNGQSARKVVVVGQKHESGGSSPYQRLVAEAVASLR